MTKGRKGMPVVMDFEALTESAFEQDSQGGFGVIHRASDQRRERIRCRKEAAREAARRYRSDRRSVGVIAPLILDARPPAGPGRRDHRRSPQSISKFVFQLGVGRCGLRRACRLEVSRRLHPGLAFADILQKAWS